MKIVLAFIFILIIIFIILKTKQKKIFSLTTKYVKFPKIDHIYCINLDDNEFRWQLFKKSSGRERLNVERVSAVDSRGNNLVNFYEKLTPISLEKLNNALLSGHRKSDNDLTPGAVGCYLSHLKVYENALRHNFDNIIVFEDDAIIPKNFIKNLPKKLPHNYDIILFGWTDPFHKKIIVDNQFSLMETFWGTFGYLINKKAMKYIVNNVNTIEEQIDSMMSRSGLYIYGLNNKLIKHNDKIITNIQTIST